MEHRVYYLLQRKFVSESFEGRRVKGALVFVGDHFKVGYSTHGPNLEQPRAQLSLMEKKDIGE